MTNQTSTDWKLLTTAAVKRLDTTTKRIREIIEDAPDGAGRLVLSLLGAAAMAVLSVVVLGRLVVWAITSDPADALGKALWAGQTVGEPFTHWLTVHLAGLPITAPTATWIWGATGGLLWLTASCHHLAGKVMWLVYGAATAAIVWAGTTSTAHRPVTTGLAVIAWTVLSLFVLVRRPQPLPRRRPTDQPAALETPSAGREA